MQGLTLGPSEDGGVVPGREPEGGQTSLAVTLRPVSGRQALPP